MLVGVIAEELLSPFAITDRTKHLADDQFLQGRIYTVGFLQPALYDETDSTVFVLPDGTTISVPSDLGAEHTIHTYVTQDYFGIWPETVVDDSATDAFYDFAHGFVPVLAPYLYYDFDKFYAPTIPVNPPLLPLIVFNDEDSFWPPTLLAGVTSGLFVDTDIIRALIIRRDGDAIVLLTEPFNDIDVFFAPSMASGLLPSLVSDSDIIYAATQDVFLRPLAFSSDDTFFAPFAYNQTNPSLFVDQDVIRGPELRTPGRMDFFEDTDVFYTASVQFASLSAPLVVEADVFPTPVYIGENAPHLPLDARVDSDDILAASIHVDQALLPHLWVDVDTILALSFAQGIFIDTDTFPAPSIAIAATPTTWNPSDKTTPVVLSSGDLRVTTGGSSTNGGVRCTTSTTTGKVYFEYTCTNLTGANTGVGIATSSANLATMGGTVANACLVYGGGSIYFNGVDQGKNIGSIGAGAVVCVAIDVTGSLLWMRLNGGNWNASGTANPATGTGGINISSLFPSNAVRCAMSVNGANADVTANFGASSFAQTVPSGFSSWSSVAT